jgi:PAS domain-containing protein
MKTGTGSEVRAYALAIFFCLVAGALAWVIDAPSSCFMLALIAASLFGGRGPAFLTIFLSSCAFEFVFLPPAFHVLHSRPSLVRMGFFVAVMLVSETILNAKRRSDLERLSIGEEFRSLAETSPDAIFIAGKDKTLLFANPAKLTMFRRSQREVLGASAEELLPGFHTPAASGEYVAGDADGRRFYVEATCGQFGDKTTVFLRDISDRKAAEEKLKKSAKTGDRQNDHLRTMNK